MPFVALDTEGPSLTVEPRIVDPVDVVPMTCDCLVCEEKRQRAGIPPRYSLTDGLRELAPKANGRK
jgi:hypothetical protein